MNINKVIVKAHAENVRKTVGNILSLEPAEIDSLLKEYTKSPDIRFSDNLLAACQIVWQFRNSYNNLFY